MLPEAICQGPAAFDERVFRALSDAGRYRFVHAFSFSKMDSLTATTVLGRMYAIGREKRDSRTLLAVLYRRYTERNLLNPRDREEQINRFIAALAEMERVAKEKGFHAEVVVGRFYRHYGEYVYRNFPREKMYVEIRQTFEKMAALGFEQLRDYDYAFMLRYCIKFMWDIEDFEEAYRYLAVAEQVIRPSEENYQHYTTVLNLLQTYWQQKKDFPKAIEYARKLQAFYRNFQPEKPEERWRNRFWQGFSLLSIAEMSLEQGDTTGVEQTADQGYAWAKRDASNADIYAYIAEYEALNVYVPIKIALGKLKQTGELLQHAAEIKNRIGVRWEMKTHKHIRFYENYARYEELRGHAAGALHYTKLARVLRDSFEQRNEVLKFEYIRQRLEAEKYAGRLRLVESEREFQKWLLNAAYVIVVLLLLLAYGWFHRLRYLRRQKEKELAAAQHALTAMTADLLEKADMVEHLRIEVERLSAAGEHSQYLEQLAGSTILTDEEWLRFRTLFEKVHPGFIAAQKVLFPGLTPAELRYLVLEKLELGTREMANMLGVSDNTIRQTRARLRRKTNGF